MVGRAEQDQDENDHNKEEDPGQAGRVSKQTRAKQNVLDVAVIGCEVISAE